MPDRNVNSIRITRIGQIPFYDLLDESYGFATLTLDFDHNHIDWPREYEELESIPPACLVELLKKYPHDWIKEQDSAVEFSTNISDYALKQSALGGVTKDQKELDWRNYSRKLQIHRELYEETKKKFLNDWKEHTPSPISPTPGFTWPASSPFSIPKKGRKTKNREKTTPPPPLFPTVTHGVDYHQFLGHGKDGHHAFKCAGNVHAIPPVEGIPGWQRITLMKTQTDGKQWCYEGVVFPGNMIMVGRWWNKGDMVGRLRLGPFIYWNVNS